MASFSNKDPPPFDKNRDSYKKWKKKLKLWQVGTDVPKARQGPLVALRLDDDTQDRIIDNVSDEDLTSDEGVKKILDHLDTLFEVDAILTDYETYENFETYVRPHGLSMKLFLEEFQLRLKKVEAAGSKLADHVLTYRILKSANISNSDFKLIKATTTELTFKNVTDQLKKVFKENATKVGVCKSEMQVKQEPTDYEQQVDTMYGGALKRKDKKFYNRRQEDTKQPFRRQEDSKQPFRRQEDSKQNARRWEDYNQRKYKKKRGKNPLDKFGNVTRCAECESINHWVQDCPDLQRYQERKTYHEEAVPYSE